MHISNKTIISIVLSAALIIASMIYVPHYAYASGTIKIEAASVVRDIDSSDTVSVDVNTTSNPGYTVGMVMVSWDTKAFELMRVDYNDSLAPDNGSRPITNSSPYPVSFGDDLTTKDYTGTGRLFTLVFRVLDGAKASTYPISLSGSSEDFLNFAMDEVPIAFSAGSIKLEGEGGSSTEDSFPFKDISEDNPNRDAIAKVHDLGIIAGTTADTFSPDMTLSRAMIVAMLWRLEGRPEVAASSFSDVPSGKYYTTAVAWAVSNKIASGYNDGKFRPEQDVTRQELAAFLYRYAKLKGKGFGGMWMFPLNYPDVDDISSYAYEPFCWMVMNGIMKEQPSGKLAPKVRATREETAVAFAGLVEALK